MDGEKKSQAFDRQISEWRNLFRDYIRPNGPKEKTTRMKWQMYSLFVLLLTGDQPI